MREYGRSSCPRRHPVRRGVIDDGGHQDLSAKVASGISLQGELYIQDDELRFPAGTVYATARYDLNTGRCLNGPVDRIRSATATAYYAYYPEYGQFMPIEHDLPDGRRLSYQVLYEGSRQAALAMLGPLKPGATR